MICLYIVYLIIIVVIAVCLQNTKSSLSSENPWVFLREMQASSKTSLYEFFIFLLVSEVGWDDVLFSAITNKCERVKRKSMRDNIS